MECEIKHIDCHVHSRFSADSVSGVKKVVDRAKSKGLSGIAITDHNTIKGGIEGKKYSSDGFLVIVGAEYSCNIGHILGLFLKEEIPAHDSPEAIIEEIHKQGGLAILAHPYKYLDEIPIDILEGLDGLETFNSRAENLFWCHQNNQKASKLYVLTGGGITAGSDAHFLFEIGRAFFSFDGDLAEEALKKAILEGKGCVNGTETSPIAELFSQIVKAFKHRKGRIVLRAITRTGWRLLRSITFLSSYIKAKKSTLKSSSIN